MRSELSKPAEELRDLIDQLLMLQNSLSDTTLELEEADNFVLLPRPPATSEAAPTAVDSHMRPFIPAELITAAAGPWSTVRPVQEGSSPQDDKKIFARVDSQIALRAVGPSSTERAVQDFQQEPECSDLETADPVRQGTAPDSMTQEWRQADANVQDLHSNDSAGSPQKISMESLPGALHSSADQALQDRGTSNLASRGSWTGAPSQEEGPSQMRQQKGGTLTRVTAVLAGERASDSLAGTDDFAGLPLTRQQDRDSDLRKTLTSLALPLSDTREEMNRSTAFVESDLPEAFVSQQPGFSGRVESDEKQTLLSLESQLSDTEAFISELQSSLAKSDSNVEELTEDIARKSQEIVDLQDRVAASTANEAKTALEMDALHLELEASQETVASMQADLEAERQLAYNNSAAHSLAIELAQQHLYGSVSHPLLPSDFI